MVVVEPHLPGLRWTPDKSGLQVQRAAMEQTQVFLGPHVNALLTDPRNRLPPVDTSSPEQLMTEEAFRAQYHR